MASINVQNAIMIGACFFVVMATRSDDSSKLENTDVYYTNTGDDTNTLLGKYYDYYNDIVFRDKLLHSLIGRGVPVDDFMSNRETADDSLARQIALGHNNDAFNSLTSNKREDERIDDIQTQQDDASEIPKKYNDPLVLDKAGHTPGSGDSKQESKSNTGYKSRTPLNQHKVNTTNTNNVISVRKRPFRRLQETCTMDSIYINIQFEEHIQTQDGSYLLLSCTDGVTVNKCEGACHSSVKPTLTSSDGYTKACSCCKDSSARTRTVTLSMCTLGSEEVYGYELTRTLLEPTSCSCQPCRN